MNKMIKVKLKVVKGTIKITSSENTTEANANEASFLDDFRKGEIQEEDLRDALEYYAEGRELKGFGPSKIRESDLEAARLQRQAAKGDDIIIEEREPPLPSRETRGREFKAKKGGGLEVVEAKGKKNKGGKAGQQRAQR